MGSNKYTFAETSHYQTYKVFSIFWKSNRNFKGTGGPYKFSLRNCLKSQDLDHNTIFMKVISGHSFVFFQQARKLQATLEGCNPKL